MRPGARQIAQKSVSKIMIIPQLIGFPDASRRFDLYQRSRQWELVEVVRVVRIFSNAVEPFDQLGAVVGYRQGAAFVP